jgi:1-acyl-sn-glycerol-3-phosphate acyltransferase
MLYKATHALARFVFKIVFNLTVIGVENVPKDGGVIVSPNHKSALDIPVVGRALPRKMYSLAKKEIFTNRFTAWYLSTMGAIPLKRNTADMSSLKAAINVLKEGKVLLMFPEGTRNKGSKLGVPKKGFIFISTKAKAPILPTGLAGTEIAMPKGSRVVKPTHIVIVFGKPIKVWEVFNPIDKDYYDKAANYVMKEIERCVEAAKEKL